MDIDRINRIIEILSSSTLPMLVALAKATIPPHADILRLRAGYRYRHGDSKA